MTLRILDSVQLHAWIYVNGQWDGVVWAGLRFVHPNSNSVLFFPLAARGQNATVYVFYTVSQVHKLRQIKARLFSIHLIIPVNKI